MYIFIRELNKLRRIHLGLGKSNKQSVLRADHEIFAFTRGGLLVLVTNAGSHAAPVQACVPLPSLPWQRGLQPINLLSSLRPYTKDDSLCMDLEEGLPVILSA